MNKRLKVFYRPVWQVAPVKPGAQVQVMMSPGASLHVAPLRQGVEAHSSAASGIGWRLGDWYKIPFGTPIVTRHFIINP